jgi:prolyl-tRNA synthetase
MRRSEFFASISKETESGLDCRSAELAVKAGLVKNFGSGTWSYTDLGNKVLNNIEAVVRDEMDEVAHEVRMNQLQTSTLWKETGRWNKFGGEEFFSFKNRDGKDFTVAATHEETATAMAQDVIQSYRDLDTAIYQIGRKFRDDHARKGLLRAKEFIMKDAYSFHKDQESMQGMYSDFVQAYRNIFDRLGLEYSEVAAENGDMGGSNSHEFIAEAEVGSDTYLKCKNSHCNYGTKDLDKEKCSKCSSYLEKVKGIEIGHCFQLDNRYTKESSLGLKYDTEDNGREEVLMACYGIGVSRLIAAIIEQNNNEEGIAWNREVSAFSTAVIVANDKVAEKAEKIYQKLNKRDDILIYNGEISVGEAFAESDLIGVNQKVILGNNFHQGGKIEVEDRDGEKTMVEGFDQLEEVIE